LICSDIVENNYITSENAVHFTSGDSNSLAGKIEYSLKHPDHMKEMAGNGRTDILNRFNWDAVAEKYLELFNSKK